MCAFLQSHSGFLFSNVINNFTVFLYICYEYILTNIYLAEMCTYVKYAIDYTRPNAYLF